MNWRAIRAVVRKDLTVVLRSKMIMGTIVGVSLVMLIVLPLGVSLMGLFIPEAASSDIEELMAMMPAPLLERFEGYTPNEIWFEYAIVYMFAPMFLIVPLMVSSVIAADSFVGERERKTMEALLHTPITNWELLLAKMLSAWLAAMAVSLLGFVLYAIIANVFGMQVLGRVFFPPVMWLLLVFWVSPATAAVGLGVSVLVSTRVSTFQEAYQASSIVVLPVVALMFGQVMGVMYFSEVLTLILGLVIWGIAAVILWLGVKTFEREKLISRL